SAGDVNGDGFDDLLIGAPQIYSGGAAYVVFGHADGFSPTVDLTTLNGSNGFEFVRDDIPVVVSSFGASVADAGDINGDGFDDLIIGEDASDYAPGRAFVLFGHAGGFGATVNLSSLNGTDGFRIVSAAGINLGTSVSGAGDVNGDGFDDIIVAGAY